MDLRHGSKLRQLDKCELLPVVFIPDYFAVHHSINVACPNYFVLAPLLPEDDRQTEDVQDRDRVALLGVRWHESKPLVAQGDDPATDTGKLSAS